MTPDDERWAEAAMVRHQHGDRAELWIAERMGVLAAAGDWAGVERFREIASRLDQLTHASVQ